MTERDSRALLRDITARMRVNEIAKDAVTNAVRHGEAKKEDFAVFKDRIVNVRLLTWGYFGFHLFSMVVMRLFLNSDSIYQHLGFWLLIIVLEHALIFGFYALAKSFIKRYTIGFIIIGTLLIGLSRTVVTTGLAKIFEIGPEYEWGFQLITGALFEVCMVLVWANVNGAYRDHRALVNDLNATRNQVLGYRENAEVILLEEQEKLQALTRETLLPQIELIEAALSQATATAEGTAQNSRWTAARDLRALIHNQVRPLSQSLGHSAKEIVRPVPNAPQHFFSVVALPRTFRVTNSIFPTTTYILMLLSFMAAPFWTLDGSWIFISSVASVLYWLVLNVLKSATKNWPELPNYAGVPLLLLFSILPVLPNYAIAVWLYPDTHKAVLYGLTIMAASVIVFMSMATLDSLDYGARSYRHLLEEENRELSLEMALFEQQLWAARKNWSLVIHGTVQAALTAALTRLNSPLVDSDLGNLVQKDLDRAVTALNKTEPAEVKLNSALNELVETWQGVCDIGVEIDAELKKIISSDSRLSMCVNEILKEAVSNAVRHGDARSASISLKQIDSAVLEVLVRNDGLRPSGNARKGLGTALLNELTLEWKLTVDENRDQTVLLAHLPFSKVQG